MSVSVCVVVVSRSVIKDVRGTAVAVRVGRVMPEAHDGPSCEVHVRSSRAVRCDRMHPLELTRVHFGRRCPSYIHDDGRKASAITGDGEWPQSVGDLRNVMAAKSRRSL